MRITADSLAAMCLGKSAFNSFTEAEKVAKRRKTRRKGPITVEPYKCRACGKFHLASRGDAR